MVIHCIPADMLRKVPKIHKAWVKFYKLVANWNSVSGSILTITFNNVYGSFQCRNLLFRKMVLLPHIPMVPSKSTIPFRRIQFPIRLVFAIFINKSQGQTISICGLHLEKLYFSYGQPYAACLHVGKLLNLFVLAGDRLTTNIE